MSLDENIVEPFSCFICSKFGRVILATMESILSHKIYYLIYGIFFKAQLIGFQNQNSAAQSLCIILCLAKFRTTDIDREAAIFCQDNVIKKSWNHIPQILLSYPHYSLYFIAPAVENHKIYFISQKLGSTISTYFFWQKEISIIQITLLYNSSEDTYSITKSNPL